MKEYYLGVIDGVQTEMNRPTCKTCPHWVGYKESVTRECRALPPQPVSSTGGAIYYFRSWTCESQSCGLHPDFPDYRAHLAAQK